MVIDYISYQDEVDKLRKRIAARQKDFRNQRIAQAGAEWTIDQILSRRIDGILRDKTNAGIRMAIIIAMADPRNPEREQLKQAHRAYLDSQAQAEAARINIDALRTDLMAVQGLVRYQQEGERYLMT